MGFQQVCIGMIVGVQFAAPPIAVAAEFSEIQARGYLVVAVKDNWRPLGFRNASGELVGLEIDLAHALAESLLGDADAVVLQPVSNAERLSMVVSGEVDLAIADVSITPARMRIVSFSDPYYLDGTGLITRNPEIQTISDLGQGRVAVLSGSDAIPTLQYQLPNTELVRVSSYVEARSLLERHGADAFAGDITVLSGWVQEYPEYQLLASILTAEPLAIVMPKGTQYDELRHRVNDLITQWHHDGWLEERATYWGLP
jgi:polar amino acid transport system substrate-binding protein